MQKLSACKKRRSEIQRRRSTSSSCMIAIWPAGPPKLIQPSFSQNQNASRSVGRTSQPAAATGDGRAWRSPSSVGSTGRRGRRRAAPSGRAVLIVLRGQREPRSSASIPCASGRRSARRHVRLVHELTDPVEREVVELVLDEDALERAASVAVAELDTAHIEGRCPRWAPRRDHRRTRTRRLDRRSGVTATHKRYGRYGRDGGSPRSCRCLRRDRVCECLDRLASRVCLMGREVLARSDSA